MLALGWRAPGDVRLEETMTGPRTRSVFDRYHIVRRGDLQEAARRLTGTRWAQSTPPRRLTPLTQPRSFQGTGG
jgi:hypothetical protein